MKKYFLAFTISALVAACGDHPDDPQGNSAALEDGHDHGEIEPLTYTTYTDSIELFVEFGPLVVGEESRFAAHFTRMGKLFTPITQGAVSVSLKVIGTPIVARADAPSSPGIFRLALTPKQEGSARLVFTLHSGSLTDTLVVDGLTVHATPHDAAHAEHSEEPLGDITYLKEQAWKIPFALERVQARPFAGSVRVGAEVEPATSGEQVLAARSAGVVHLMGNAPLEGMAVKSGQALFSLSSQGITVENPGASVQQARNDFERANAEQDRVEELYKDKLVTQAEVLAARNAFANARARLEQSSGAQTISAGIEGYVPCKRVKGNSYKRGPCSPL